ELAPAGTYQSWCTDPAAAAIASACIPRQVVAGIHRRGRLQRRLSQYALFHAPDSLGPGRADPAGATLVPHDDALLCGRSGQRLSRAPRPGPKLTCGADTARGLSGR